MKFFLGPAGRIVLLAVAFVGWTVYQRADATRDCQDEQLRSALIESQRQLEIANRIAQDARVRADLRESEMAETERLYDELRTDLQNRPETACGIDNDTRERLLRIK